MRVRQRPLPWPKQSLTVSGAARSSEGFQGRLVRPAVPRLCYHFLPPESCPQDSSVRQECGSQSCSGRRPRAFAVRKPPACFTELNGLWPWKVTGLDAKGSKKRCLWHKRWWFPKILLEIKELFSYSWTLLKLARSEWTGTRLFPAKEGSWRKQFPTYLGTTYEILHLSFMETSNMVNTFKQIFGSTAPQLWWAQAVF